MKRKWFWCVGDHWGSDLAMVLIYMSAKKPNKLSGTKDRWEQVDYSFTSMRPKDFRHLFGFLPPSDRPVRVAFTATVNK